MPANFPMPKHDRVKELLTDLMGRTVSVEAAEPAQIVDSDTAALADYEAANGSLGVVCLADVRLANALGAALTMIAPTVVDDAVARREIDDPTIDNLREVVNIMTTLFNSTFTPHLKFRTIHRLPTGDLPSETADLLRGPRARRDYRVTVEEYGTGTLSVLIA
jgi:hypothetical protein